MSGEKAAGIPSRLCADFDFPSARSEKHLFMDRLKGSRASTQNQAVTETERRGFLDRL